MKVIYKKLPSKRIECIATIGVFDGIHLGHQFILKKVKDEAKRKGVSSLLITFDNPPQLVLNRKFFGYLIDQQQKRELVESLGIDYLWVLKTTPSFLRLSGKEFVNYILKHMRVKKFIVGRDFRFGYKGETDITHLKKFGIEYQFELEVLKKKQKNKKIISSSLLRNLIRTASFKEAENILGRPYFLKGKVFKAQGLGRKLEFPTANLDTFSYVIPPLGVYAAYVKFGGKIYLSGVNIGMKPTIAKSREIGMEVHIINFRENILGKIITLIFLEKIREEKKFFSLGELKKQIARDIDYISKKYGKEYDYREGLIKS